MLCVQRCWLPAPPRTQARPAHWSPTPLSPQCSVAHPARATAATATTRSRPTLRHSRPRARCWGPARTPSTSSSPPGFLPREWIDRGWAPARTAAGTGARGRCMRGVVPGWACAPAWLAPVVNPSACVAQSSQSVCNCGAWYPNAVTHAHSCSPPHTHTHTSTHYLHPPQSPQAIRHRWHLPQHVPGAAYMQSRDDTCCLPAHAAACCNLRACTLHHLLLFMPSHLPPTCVSPPH